MLCRCPNCGVSLRVDWRQPFEGYSSDFEVFWGAYRGAYPRRVAKRAAWRVWIRTNPPLDDILTALEWQRRQPQWLEDRGQFIPHPATYLLDARWLDEQPLAAGEEGEKNAE